MDYRERVLDWLRREKLRLAHPLTAWPPWILRLQAWLFGIGTAGLALYSASLSGQPLSAWLLGLAAAGLSIGGLVALDRSERWLARIMPQRLDDSRIAEALADSGQRMASIYEHTPPVLRRIALGPEPQGLMDSLRLLAKNLDWYLGPPRPHLRALWLVLPFSVLLTGVMLLLSRMSIGIDAAGSMASITLCVFSLLDSLIVIERRRYSESIRFLMRHMQQRFYEHGNKVLIEHRVTEARGRETAEEITHHKDTKPQSSETSE